MFLSANTTKFGVVDGSSGFKLIFIFTGLGKCKHNGESRDTTSISAGGAPLPGQEMLLHNSFLFLRFTI